MLQVGKDLFGDNTIQNFKDNNINTGNYALGAIARSVMCPIYMEANLQLILTLTHI